MSVTKLLLGAALAALWAVPSAALAQSENATALLRAAIDAPNHISFVGQVQRIEYGQSQAEATVFRIEHCAPSLSRRWYLAPQTLYGDSIISRGDTNYDVDVKHDRVIVSKDDAIDDQVALDDNFGLMSKNYRAILGPTEEVAGRTATTVLMINKFTGQTVMRIWIDKATNLMLQNERYASNGSITYQMRFEQLRFIDKLPASTFSIPTFARIAGPNHGQPSSDLRAVVRTAGFSAHNPKYLPDGFVPITGDVTDVKGIRTLHLLYSDGIRTVSLFENARGAAADLSTYQVHDIRFGSNSAQYVERGPTTLLAWNDADSGLYIAIVGEMTRDELLRIAVSIDP